MTPFRKKVGLFVLVTCGLISLLLYLNIYNSSYKSRPAGSIPVCRQSSPHKRLDFTVVTALFDIGRGKWRNQARSFSEYLAYFQQLLSLDVNLIVFIEPKALDFIRKHRVACQDRTLIIPTRINQLEYYKLRPRMEAIMASERFKADNQMLGNAEGYSAQYNIIMNSKFYLLNNMTYLNPFNSTHFMWIDSGYGHGLDIGFPKNGVWLPKKFLATKNKVSVIQMQDPSAYKDIHSLYKVDIAPVFIGGFFGGDIQAVRELHRIHEEVLTDAMTEGWIDDDQTFLLLSYYTRPALFNRVLGEYWSLFDVIK